MGYAALVLSEKHKNVRVKSLSMDTFLNLKPKLTHDFTSDASLVYVPAGLR